MHQLKLGHLLSYKGGLDATMNWADILSGGEQQRLAFARLFFHKPEFVLMDEATSALDVDTEALCMEMCKGLKMTLLSVGHRSTLRPYHERIILLDKTGRLEF